MKSSKCIDNIRNCRLFVEEFAAMLLDVMTEDDSLKIAIVGKFAEHFINNGFTLNAGFNVEMQKLVFSGRSSHCDSGDVSWINIRYESGISPICYWIGADQKRVNCYYPDAIPFERTDEWEVWFEKIHAEYLNSTSKET